MVILGEPGEVFHTYPRSTRVLAKPPKSRSQRSDEIAVTNSSNFGSMFLAKYCRWDAFLVSSPAVSWTQRSEIPTKD